MIRITIERLSYLKDRFEADSWYVDDVTGIMTIVTKMTKKRVLIWTEAIESTYDYRYLGMSENSNGITLRFGL